MRNPFKRASLPVRAGRSVLGVLDSPGLTRTTTRISNAAFLISVTNAVVELVTGRGIGGHLATAGEKIAAKAEGYTARRAAAHIDA